MQKLSTTAGAALVLGVLGAPAQAAEFRALLGGWGSHVDGTVDDRGTRYDLRDDLELSPNRRRSLGLEFDTRPGWWPDFAASWTQMGADGDHTETVMVGPIPMTRTIATDADFDSFSLVARYPFRLGPFRLSGGIAAQQLRGDIVIDDSDAPSPLREHYDEVFPQLHASLRWKLGPVALVAAGQGVEYDGDRAVEWGAGVELRFMQPLLIEAGWHEKRYEIELPDYALDARLRGALFRVGFLYR